MQTSAQLGYWLTRGWLQKHTFKSCNMKLVAFAVKKGLASSSSEQLPHIVAEE
jgi:hypothetical protein